MATLSCDQVTIFRNSNVAKNTILLVKKTSTTI